MGSEHDDDMELEVEEGAEGETAKYAVVAEDIEERAAEAEQVRLRQIPHTLEDTEGDDVE